MSDPQLDPDGLPTDPDEMSTPELVRAVFDLQRRIYRTLRHVLGSLAIVGILVVAMNGLGILRQLRDVHYHRIRNEQAHNVQACLTMARPQDPPAPYRSEADLARCRQEAARIVREIFGVSAEDLGVFVP
jgi:hypothetical protein